MIYKRFNQLIIYVIFFLLLLNLWHSLDFQNGGSDLLFWNLMFPQMPSLKNEHYHWRKELIKVSNFTNKNSVNFFVLFVWYNTSLSLPVYIIHKQACQDSYTP